MMQARADRHCVVAQGAERVALLKGHLPAGRALLQLGDGRVVLDALQKPIGLGVFFQVLEIDRVVREIVRLCVDRKIRKLQKGLRCAGDCAVGDAGLRLVEIPQSPQPIAFLQDVK